MADEVYVPDRVAWQQWLTEHWSRSTGTWLVHDKDPDRALTYVHDRRSSLPGLETHQGRESPTRAPGWPARG